MKKKICYFGIYDPAYARNKNNIIGFKENDIEVVEIVDQTQGYGKYYRLAKKVISSKDEFEFIVVGFPGQIALLIAKLFFKKSTPVILDLFVSYYDSIILERKEHSKWSLHALWFYFLDWISCFLADYVLMDTSAHGEYVSSLLHIDPNKIIIVYVGMDGRLFKPSEIENINAKGEDFLVSFHGNIQLLNGMDLVVKAIKTMEKKKVRLQIIGGGPEYGNIKKLASDIEAKNIIFLGSMAPEELSKKVSVANLGLGFFSLSRKIDRVIANKIYELIAMKIPIVTGKSKAMEEHFKHKVHVYYCERGDVRAIRKAILEMKNNPDLRAALTENAFKYATNYLTPQNTIEHLLSVLRK